MKRYLWVVEVLGTTGGERLSWMAFSARSAARSVAAKQRKRAPNAIVRVVRYVPESA